MKIIYIFLSSLFLFNFFHAADMRKVVVKPKVGQVESKQSNEYVQLPDPAKLTDVQRNLLTPDLRQYLFLGIFENFISDIEGKSDVRDAFKELDLKIRTENRVICCDDDTLFNLCAKSDHTCFNFCIQEIFSRLIENAEEDQKKHCTDLAKALSGHICICHILDFDSFVSEYMKKINDNWQEYIDDINIFLNRPAFFRKQILKFEGDHIVKLLGRRNSRMLMRFCEQNNHEHLGLATIMNQIYAGKKIRPKCFCKYVLSDLHLVAKKWW